VIKTFNLIYLAVKRCKNLILSVFIAYCISCLVGIVMSQNGNNFALSYRDKIVGKAMKTDKASINYQEGNNFLAALNDFKGNLLFGAVPQTLMGFGIVIPYFSVLRQGWVGGIVSVDSEHKSRLRDFKSSFYYFFVLLLQFVPYSLAIGAGVKSGLDFYNFNKLNGWMIWKYKIQKASLADLGYIYIIVVPLFFIASCFEFLSTWNV
jgi:hypothetical protein